MVGSFTILMYFNLWSTLCSETFRMCYTCLKEWLVRIREVFVRKYYANVVFTVRCCCVPGTLCDNASIRVLVISIT